MAFLPSRASFYTTFIRNRGIGYGFETATCLKTVVEVNQGHAPVKYFHSNKAFFVSIFMDVI